MSNFFAAQLDEDVNFKRGKIGSLKALTQIRHPLKTLLSCCCASCELETR